MSIQKMSHVWQYSRAKSGTLLVLLAIADYSDDAGVAYPSLAMLCFKSRMTERNVRYCLQQLTMTLRELKVEYGMGPHGRTRYTVLTTPETGENFSPRKILPGEVDCPPGEEVDCPPPRKEKGTQKEITTKALKTPSVKTPPDLLSRFEEFWQAYPRKHKKGQARKAWISLKPNQSLLDQILEAIAAQRSSTQWTKDDGQFIPLPATWLNAEQWLDETSTTPYIAWDEL